MNKNIIYVYIFVIHSKEFYNETLDQRKYIERVTGVVSHSLRERKRRRCRNGNSKPFRNCLTQCLGDISYSKECAGLFALCFYDCMTAQYKGKDIHRCIYPSSTYIYTCLYVFICVCIRYICMFDHQQNDVHEYTDIIYDKSASTHALYIVKIFLPVSRLFSVHKYV